MPASTNIALVPVDDDLVASSVDSLRSTLDALMDEGCRRIVLNAAGATRIDSAGVGLIVGAARRMRARGGLISLTNVSSDVQQVLTRMRIVDFVPVSGPVRDERLAARDPSGLPLWRTILPIEAANLAATRRHVSALVDRFQLPPDDAFDLNLAVGEAIGNAVDHAQGCSLVTVACYRDRAVVEVSDCGEGFDPDEQVGGGPDDTAAERGRGIMLMRLLADAVTIMPKPNGTGTVVRIVKLLPQ